MKLAVIGATGGTDSEVVKKAFEAGHEITAFVRDAGRLSIKNDQLTIVTGDVFDADVADLVLKELEENKLFRKAVTITN